MSEQTNARSDQRPNRVIRLRLPEQNADRHQEGQTQCTANVFPAGLPSHAELFAQERFASKPRRDLQPDLLTALSQ
jgi:hypothetical protein